MKKIHLGEILAVVGILAFIAAVLYPVFAQAKGGGNKWSCMSNLRRIANSFGIYRADSDDRFPSRDDWIDATYPYARNWRIYDCPTVPRVWGYAFNGVLDRALMPTHAEDVALVYDSSNPIKNASDLFTSVPSRGRHYGKNGVAYADGHVSAIAP